MDYKKKYKNALEWARQVMNGETGFIRKEVEEVFPELKESEDEKIRKALIKYYSFDKNGGSHALDNITPKQIVVWLEKQSIDISSFPEEQQVFMQKYTGLDKITLIKLLAERDANNAEIIESFEKQGERKPVLEMKTPEESLGIDSDTYNKIVDECIYGEQKPAWSEEDEKILNFIIARLHSHPNVGLEEYSKEYSWLIYTLKSLKPQSRWKPSDEQIKVLDEILIFAANHESPHWNDYIFETLNNLIKQLIIL